MTRVTSFLEIKSTIDFYNPYYVSDNIYNPPGRYNVDFLLDPNINMRVTSIFLSDDKFRADTFFLNNSTYSFQVDKEFLCPAFSVEVKTGLIFLDEFYHPTAFFEDFSTYEVKSSFTFLDEQAALIKSAFVHDDPVHVKSFYLINNFWAPIIKSEFTAISLFSEPKKMPISFGSIFSNVVFGLLDSGSDFSKIVKSNNEWKNDCVKSLKSPNEWSNDCSKRVQSFSEHKNDCSKRVQSFIEYKNNYSKLVQIPIEWKSNIVKTIKASIAIKLDANSVIKTSYESLNDCKNIVNNFFEHSGDCVDKIVIRADFEDFGSCDDSFGFNVTMSVNVPDLTSNVKVTCAFEFFNDFES